MIKSFRQGGLDGLGQYLDSEVARSRKLADEQLNMYRMSPDFDPIRDDGKLRLIEYLLELGDRIDAFFSR